MNLEKLLEPFPPEDIKQREGPSGQILDYVETHRVIQRLNDVFGGQWSFKVLERERLDREVVVLGELTAEGIAKQQFGASDIKLSRSKKDPISIGDDYKAAASDALKKCATMFGVALHLYESKNEKATSRRSGKVRQQAPPEDEELPPPEDEQEGQKPEEKKKGKGSKVAEQQKEVIKNLLGKLDVKEEQIDALIKERYQVTLDDLSYEQRTNIIKKLSEEVNSRNKKKAA